MTSIQQLSLGPSHVTRLPGPFGSAHVFEGQSIAAVNAALAARRPLLIRGEPGVGKSQLARAVAQELGRVFLSRVVDQHTEARDLLWEFDPVARLAQAQLLAALPKLPSAKGKKADSAKEEGAVSAELDPRRFVAPGELWWALSWQTASRHVEVHKPVHALVPATPVRWQPQHGAVVLIDEVDKSDPSLPNGLLEYLGEASFQPMGYSKRITAGESGAAPPLVIITTNEERALPDAFVRRCLVLHLELPEKPEPLMSVLIERARAHFGSDGGRLAGEEDALLGAAELLVEDRARARELGLSPPGQAEYLDLLRAAAEQAGNGLTPAEAVSRNASFVYRKHRQLAGTDGGR